MLVRKHHLIWNIEQAEAALMDEAGRQKKMGKPWPVPEPTDIQVDFDCNRMNDEWTKQ